jgi:steroid delta-isomerase-like uncharacterized protein
MRQLCDNKAFVRRLIDELFNQKRVGAIATFYAPHCEGNSPAGPFRDREGLSASFEKYALAFPDFQLEINYMVAEGDRVVVHYTFAGTHTGDLAGFPATRRQLRIPGVMITRLAAEKIVEQYFVWDNLGPIRQIWLALKAETQMCGFGPS